MESILEVTQNPMEVLVIFSLFWLSWYIYQRYLWYAMVIKKNPNYASYVPVVTKATEGSNKGSNKVEEKVIAPSCTFRQYLKYLQLVCLPYLWSVPIKVMKQMFQRQFKSKLTDYQKRYRLAKMVLETSLTLGFERKDQDGVYHFVYQKFRMPSKKHGSSEHQHINKCFVTIQLDQHQQPILNDITIDGNNMGDLNEMFSFLNTLWCVYTHTLTHVMAGNIAEANINGFQDRDDITDEFKQSIDEMHAVVSGMNESANHYPADIWGIHRKQLQIILGYNAAQQFGNHQNIIQCYEISNFIKFTMKARKIFSKHLSNTGISISTLAANTIFHSLDHYNMGKYFLHDSEDKKYLGVDSRMITALLGDLNYDLGRWQGMKYAKDTTWQIIYHELTLLDEELADKVHMFVSV